MNAITRRINPNRINHPINCETLNLKSTRLAVFNSFVCKCIQFFKKNPKIEFSSFAYRMLFLSPKPIGVSATCCDSLMDLTRPHGLVSINGHFHNDRQSPRTRPSRPPPHWPFIERRRPFRRPVYSLIIFKLKFWLRIHLVCLRKLQKKNMNFNGINSKKKWFIKLI